MGGRDLIGDRERDRLAVLAVLLEGLHRTAHLEHRGEAAFDLGDPGGDRAARRAHAIEQAAVVVDVGDDGVELGHERVVRATLDEVEVGVAHGAERADACGRRRQHRADARLRRPA